MTHAQRLERYADKWSAYAMRAGNLHELEDECSDIYSWLDENDPAKTIVVAEFTCFDGRKGKVGVIYSGGGRKIGSAGDSYPFIDELEKMGFGASIDKYLKLKPGTYQLN